MIFYNLLIDYMILNIIYNIFDTIVLFIMSYNLSKKSILIYYFKQVVCFFIFISLYLYILNHLRKDSPHTVNVVLET